MKIAQVIASLEGRHGGPSRSSQGLAQGLADMGHSVSLLAAGTSEQTDVSGSLSIHTYARGFPARFSASSGLRQAIRQGSFEVVHNHGLWLRPLHYAHRYTSRNAVPLVISPRGMMEPWAWNHHKRRKQFAQFWVHPGALTATSGWHATSNGEADSIRDLGFKQPICVAPNGVEIPSDQQLQIAREFWWERVPQLRERKVGLFYSRLHSKKRVIELIDLWRKLAPKDWLLLLVGIPDQFTIEQLRAQLLREGANNSIFVFDGTYQPPPYAVANLFILPSHSENFGLVVAESLAAGVPVITTDTTPWQGLDERDAGWCVNYADFDASLSHALVEATSVLSRRGALGKAWVKADFTWDVVAQKLSGFYRELHRTEA